MYIKDNDTQRKKEIYEHITMVNIFSLFIVMATLILGGDFFQEELYTSIDIKVIFFLMISLISFTLILAYLSKNRSTQKKKFITKYDVFYILLFTLGAVFALLLVGDKFYFAEVILLLPIIIAASIWGKRCGLLMATMCTFILFINYFTENTLGHFWQGIGKNLIFISIMYIVGWFIGAIADLEGNYRRSLTILAHTDSLTGLYNHRYFQDKLAEYSETATKESPLSLVLIDIDNFKHYNDSFGHIAGDDVIKKVANVLKTTLNDQGFVARYGGEEFVVVLPNCSSEQAALVAEEMRYRVSKCKFMGHRYQLEERITISSGISSYPSHAKDIKELLKYADQALYRAKSMEKNKVEIYFSIFDNLELGENEQDVLNTIYTLISVINAKDRYTYGHSERVKDISMKLAKTINLKAQDLKILAQAAALHDIGKIEVSRGVLNKVDKLTDEEFIKIKNHAVWGSEIVKEIEPLRPASDIILYHHENYDGTGYPEGLKGEQIPILARIIRIVDSFDAMVSNRPYKNTMSKLEALAELKRCSGTMFDPVLVEDFINMIREEKIKKI